MSARDAASAVEVLARVEQGGVTYREIAEALECFESMYLMVSQADTRRMLEQLDEALAEKGIGNVTTKDGAAPRILGDTDANGVFRPRVFTSSETLHEYSVASGAVAPDATYFSSARPWGSGLYELLIQGCGGLIVDPGSDHELSFDRLGLMHLVAQITLAGFAGIERIYGVAVGDKVLYQKGEGDVVMAFAYDTEQAVHAGLPAVRRRVPDIVATPVAPAAYARGILGNGVTRLVVNPGLADERAYGRADLTRLIELAEGAAASAPAAAPPAPALDPALDPDAGAPAGDAGAAGEPEGPSVPPGPRHAAALAAPTPAPVPPPGRDDTASRARFLEVKALGDAGAPPWRLSTALGFDLDYHVTVNPRAHEGRRWPTLYADEVQATGEPVTIAHLYTTGAAAAKELARIPEEHRRVHVLSGVEAFRWIWSCPQPIREVFVDHPDPGGWITLSDPWLLPILFPTLLGIPELEAVPAVPLDKLGTLPRIEGLEPRALRALVRGWQSLLGPALAGDPVAPVSVDGGRWLAVYTDAERFFEHASAARGPRPATPEGAGDAPRFADWLVAARELDGVVVNPGSPRPLTLEHTELLQLELWARLGRQPRGEELFAKLGTLLSTGAIDTALAGRIAADWPAYFFGRMEPLEILRLVLVPGTDDLALFTSEAALEAFLDVFRATGALRDPVRAQQLLPRWGKSVFHAAREGFSGLWIDPEAAEGGGVGGGLRLDPDGIDAALARLELRLRPRVPDFEA